MANQLKMAKVNAIKTLAQRGWSQRQIAKALHVSRHTVARYLAAADSKCATSAPGSNETDDDSKCATSAPGSEALELAESKTVSKSEVASRSHCEPFRQVIIDGLDAGLSASFWLS